MSRSGYVDDSTDNPILTLWPSIVQRGIKGKRGQRFLIALRGALEALPEKRLIAEQLQTPDGEVCALGALAKQRGMDVTKLDPEDPKQVGAKFNIPKTLAQEVAFINDDDLGFLTTGKETPEQRYQRVLAWVNQNIQNDSEAGE